MEQVTAGKEELGAFAPKFAELNDDVLFGEIWTREKALSPRDRSLITVTALTTAGIFDGSLKFHLKKAKENGVSKTEIAEALTHLAFYGGWPKAWAAFRMAKEVWSEDEDGERAEFTKKSIFPSGEKNDAYKNFFVGQSYLNPLTSQGVNIANVTFEPRCRNNWHVHRAEEGGGQILLCTAGEGWYRERGKSQRKLLAGDVVVIPAGTEHWHGAAADSWFSHLAVEVPGKNASTEWLEAVSDEEYDSVSKE